MVNGRPGMRGRMRPFSHRPFRSLRPGSSPRQFYPPQPPQIFDISLLEHIFVPVNKPSLEGLQSAIQKKAEELTPSEKENASLANAVSEVQKIFDALIKTPGTFTACTVDEVHVVGSFKKGTILADHKTADIVVVLKTLPFIKSIEVLAARIMEDIRKSEELLFGCGIEYTVTEEGFDIFGPPGRIRLLIATLPSNLSKLDQSVHLPFKILENNLAAIKHCRWFEEHCQSKVIQNVVRVLRYIRSNYKGFEDLNPWMIDLLAHYAVTRPKLEPLTEGPAFKRAMQLLASGIMLAGSSGIPDPCDRHRRTYKHLSYEQQDIICLTAQTIVRLLSHGGPLAVLNAKSSIVATATMWKGVIVNPSDKAYEKPPEKKEPVEDMEISVEEEVTEAT